MRTVRPALSIAAAIPRPSCRPDDTRLADWARRNPGLSSGGCGAARSAKKSGAALPPDPRRAAAGRLAFLGHRFSKELRSRADGAAPRGAGVALAAGRRGSRPPPEFRIARRPRGRHGLGPVPAERRAQPLGGGGGSPRFEHASISPISTRAPPGPVFPRSPDRRRLDADQPRGADGAAGPGDDPERHSGRPSEAAGRATRQRQPSAISSPPPSAAPLTREPRDGEVSMPDHVGEVGASAGGRTPSRRRRRRSPCRRRSGPRP